MIRSIVAVGLLALLSVAQAGAEPFRHSSGEWREYNRDWLASCPERINEDDTTSYYGTSCFSSVGSVELNDANLPVYKLTLLHNRLTGAIDIAFTYAPSDGSVVDTTRPLIIRFGSDAPMRFEGDALETRYNTTNQFFITDPARVEALLEAMRERNAATITVPVTGDEPAERRVTLSMRGVLASLDFMHTYARRVGSYDE
jgi:hypothetical protein